MEKTGGPGSSGVLVKIKDRMSNVRNRASGVQARTTAPGKTGANSYGLIWHIV